MKIGVYDYREIYDGHVTTDVMGNEAVVVFDCGLRNDNLEETKDRAWLLMPAKNARSLALKLIKVSFGVDRANRRFWHKKKR